VLGPDDFGLFMSTGGFTRDVMEELGTHNYIKINAMDLEKFFDLWIKQYGKLNSDAQSHLPLKPVYFLAPPE
jgi:hypothetical protein